MSSVRTRAEVPDSKSKSEPETEVLHEKSTTQQPNTRVTRSRMRLGVQKILKHENIADGAVKCPECQQIILVADRGCNIITCVNHQPRFLYFCIHCKGVSSSGTEILSCACPSRNTRVTRAQAQKRRNRLAAENPIEIDLSCGDEGLGIKYDVSHDDEGLGIKADDSSTCGLGIKIL